MTIATALNFDPLSRSVKVAAPTDGPAFEALRACPQLRGAPVEALRTIARQSTVRPVSRGTIVAAQGSRLDFAILVVRGTLRSVCRAENGREISIEVFRSPEMIADGRGRARRATPERLGGHRDRSGARDSPGAFAGVPQVVARSRVDGSRGVGDALGAVQDSGDRARAVGRSGSRCVSTRCPWSPGWRSRTGRTVDPQPPHPAGARQSDWRVP